MGQAGVTNGRPQVGEEPEMFAQREQRRAFGLLRRREAFPFRTAHAAEEDGVRPFANGEGFRRQRVPKLVDRGPADGGRHQVKAEVMLLGRRVQDAQRLVHHLRPDPVPGQHRNLKIRHAALLNTGV